MKKTLIKDMKGIVLCDYCNEDYSNSDESGGLVFTSKGICPKCAPDALKRIKGYGEESYIKAVCPKGMSFKEFIIRYRGDNDKVYLLELDEGESFSDVFGGEKHE